MARCVRCHSCESMWSMEPCNRCNYPHEDIRTTLEIKEDDEYGKELYGTGDE